MRHRDRLQESLRKRERDNLREREMSEGERGGEIQRKKRDSGKEILSVSS